MSEQRPLSSSYGQALVLPSDYPASSPYPYPPESSLSRLDINPISIQVKAMSHVRPTELRLRSLKQRGGTKPVLYLKKGMRKAFRHENTKGKTGSISSKRKGKPVARLRGASGIQVLELEGGRTKSSKSVSSVTKPSP
ncbi:hypothetical protein PVK06_001599 [Gossypium arboreum]|uniref:Uncharacterized protein n=1 Tax=Gossypium arboreum TaxID=29729 RepID=A0ABR0R1F0_GOSAR|nr:hypothetical protein PVK06_001599 [Gossypium arboreum]